MSRRVSLTIIVAAIGCLLSRCSVSPSGYVDGGTHTGNPEVVACASAIFGLFEADSAWRIATYLDSGKLNPASIAPPANGLGKTSAASSPADSVVLRLQTVLIPDTHFVNDTIVRDSIISIAINTTVNGEAQTFLVDTLRRDSVFITDTLITYDTLIVSDTLRGSANKFSSDTATNTEYKQGLRYDSVTYAGSQGSPYYIFSDMTGPQIKNADVPAAKFTITSLSAVMSFATAWQTPDATVVRQRYTDADGDKRLFAAGGNITPVVWYTESKTASRWSQALTATIDAGADADFTARGDNRVRLFSRATMRDNDTVSLINYINDATTDTAMLRIHEIRPATDIFDRLTAYTIVADTHDLPAAIDASLVYNRGVVDRIVMRLTQLAAHRYAFDATITLIGGEITTLAGSADAVTGIEAGYTHGAIRDSVSVDRDGKVTIRH
jgi:hypothetical protein